MKVIDRVSSSTAEWAADEFINYFGNFTSIEDYLRFVKKEVISQTSSLFPLHDEFFNEDIHPEDMELIFVLLEIDLKILFNKIIM